MRRLTLVLLILLPVWPAAAEIPYRYSIQEGFILAIDDASKRSIAQDTAAARAALDTLAELMESDRFRIPVEYGRTLVWNLGQRLGERIERDAHLSLYREARRHDASRAMPASVLFMRLSFRDGRARAVLDWMNLSRGESEARFASDRIPVSLPPGCAIEDACAAGPLSEALTPFFAEAGRGILDLLGPAPPRGYGDVPPAWLLVEPIRYRIDIIGLDADLRDEALDAMALDLDHFISMEVASQDADRLVLSYETQAPSWWLADRMADLFDELDAAVIVNPRTNGLTIQGSD